MVKRGRRNRAWYWFRGEHRMLGAVCALAVGASLLGPISAQAATVDPHKIWSPTNTALPHTASISGHDVGLPAARKPHYPVPGQWQPPATAPAVTGSATVRLPVVAGNGAKSGTALLTGSAVRAGSLPVWLAAHPATGASGGAQTADGVTATVADAASTKAAGVNGLLVSLAPSTASTSKSQVQVGLDMSSLDASYGADAAERSHLVELPRCSLTTPQIKGCLAATPVASYYDPVSKRLVADVTLPASTVPAAAKGTGITQALAVTPVATQAPLTAMVLAAQTTSGGGGGTYAATSLQSSSNWTSGNSSGGFDYNYPIQIPPTIGGVAPSVSLSYDSSSVDGKTSASNSQASNVGDGWDLSAGGFIERSYQSCEQDGITGSGDLCWGGNVATLSLAGHSGQLVRDDTTGTWHLSDDDSTKVEFVTAGQSGGNGGSYGEYVKVTDTSGTVYYFGLNHLPGGDGTDPSTNSSWSEPVYSPNSGNPCYSAAQGQASWCNMPWRMNLSYAVDVHGNLVTYTYTPDATNYYQRGGGQNQGTGVLTGYTSGGSLTRIDYGQTLAGQVAAKGQATIAASVLFNLAPEGRCDTSGGFTCTGATLSSTNATHWPDVPYDQHCASAGACSNYGPSFWTNQRLASITTQIQSNGATKQVDSYALTQTYPNTGDGTKPPLWLASIQHTGLDGSPSILLPAVTFTAVMMANRVDGTNLVPAPAAFYRPRIQTITTETGERLNVDYNLPDCSRLNKVMPASADSDTMGCYNVLWYPPGSTVGQPPASDWFNHYTVASVTANDTVAGAPSRVTSYTYGPAAWHYDDSELTDPKTRTWDQFRGFASVTTITGTGGDGPQGKNVTYYMQGMDGDHNADNSAKSVQAGTGTLGGTTTDDDWLSGHVLESDTYADATSPGTVLSYTATRSSGPVTTGTHARGNSLPDLVARYASTTITSTQKRLEAQGSWRTAASTTVTDPSNGNRILSKDSTGDGLTETCTRDSYATSSNTQISELIDESLTVSGSNACTATATKDNTVTGTRTLYDSLPFGQAGIGQPTSSLALDSFDSNGNPVYVAKAATTYDSYGRIVSSTDPNATDTAHASGAVITTTYKSAAAGELPNEVDTTSPVPNKTTTWSSKQTLEPARGSILTSSDANSKVSTNAYDALGRTVSVWKPGNPATKAADILYTYAVNGTSAPSTTTTASFGPKSAKRLYSIQIFNGFAEVAQTQETPAISAYTGRLITDSYYDSQGRVVKAHAPWYNDAAAPSTTLYATSDTQVPTETTTAYDGAGRPTLSTFLSLSHAQSSTSTTYRGMDTTDVTPPGGATPTTTVTDTAGRTSQTWQYRTTTATGNASDADITTTTYTPAGLPATRTDSTGKNTWTYSYDLQGRSTKTVDPDAGTNSTTYTADGQTASTTDARNKTLAYTYDLLGRKTGEYNGSVSATNQLAAWTYDSNVLAGQGQLATATRYTAGASGPAITQTQLGYDDDYHSYGTTTTIPASVIGQSKDLSYTAQAGYDHSTGVMLTSDDGVAADQPDELLNYTYDVNGTLSTYGSSRSTYDLSTNNDPWGRPIRTTLNPWGTEVVSTYNYDQGTGHILSDFIDKQTALTGSVDQYNYTYNQAGQLTSAQDIPDNTPASSDTQCFTYDYLGRLTTAWTDTGKTTVAAAPSVGGVGGCTNTTPTSGAAAGKTTVGGPAAYWTSYTYDLTGNRTSATAHNPTGDTTKDVTTTQTFPAAGTANTPTNAPNTGGGTGGPHALSGTTTTGTTGPTTYQYDADGNTTAISSTPGTTTMTWDAEGHLASEKATAAAAATTYIYDASGNLLVRTDPDKTTTVMLGADEITYAPNGTATDTRSYATPNGLTILRHGTAENFQISDPHGTAELDINATTLTETRRYLDPFGTPRGTSPTGWTTANGYGDKGFVGGTQDPNTGLTNLGAREYQSSTGRFLSIDPLFNPGDPQSWNGYAYGGNSPTDASDPSGLATYCADTCPGEATGSGSGPVTVDPKPKSQPQPVVDTTCDSSIPGCPGYKTPSTRVDTDLQLPPTFKNSAQFLADYWKIRSKYVVGDAMPLDEFRTAFIVCMTFKGVCSRGEALQIGALYGLALNYVSLSVGGGEKPAGEGAGSRGLNLINLDTGSDMVKVMAEHDDPIPSGMQQFIRDSCGTNSFPGSTAVLMSGGTSKSIDAVHVGDTVIATNPLDGTTRPEHVTNIIKTLTDTDFTDLSLSTPAGTQTITSTQHHPYWDATTQRWTNAADLHAGDRLREPGGHTTTVTHIRNYTGHTVTYNLTVADIHTYYVLAGTTPILVHNCGTGPDGLIDLGAASKSGAAADKGGYSVAGRALQKHAGRPGTGGNWPRPTGRENPTGWNEAGQNMLDDILTSPDSVAHLGYGRVGGTWQDTLDVRLPSGLGARFDLGGNFSGFLD